MLNVIQSLFKYDTITNDENQINKLYMLNFNYYLYSYLTKDNQYLNCITNTVTDYYENDKMISYSIVYKNIQSNLNLDKHTVFAYFQ